MTVRSSRTHAVNEMIQVQVTHFIPRLDEIISAVLHSEAGEVSGPRYSSDCEEEDRPECSDLGLQNQTGAFGDGSMLGQGVCRELVQTGRAPQIQTSLQNLSKLKSRCMCETEPNPRWCERLFRSVV